MNIHRLELNTRNEEYRTAANDTWRVTWVDFQDNRAVSISYFNMATWTKVVPLDSPRLGLHNGTTFERIRVLGDDSAKHMSTGEDSNLTDHVSSFGHGQMR